ncbi:NAD-glutamate dehydrogenase [Alsobacter metallidurans]|uniref:NAD-glutamate dehydrogenase n=1 Tax=Alsobacter metallidurans TaxID=340221 RepID=A0A917IA42_9HYPH|nr:NAD-glutamate dehydrogenase [Alsobacter metallidurans]GGH30116.1 NAD-glutamate dehydrogenase [Alsobacter metallidurans]
MLKRDRDGRQGLVSAVVEALPAAGASVPDGFVEALFARVSPEDLSLYSPADLASFAASAFEHLSAPRRQGREDIRFTDRRVQIGGHERDITVLEALNDNMPFLLDSTLAELTERGITIRFVTHPIVAVERDAEGRLVRFAGEAMAGGQPGARRESLIQVHVDRLDGEEARQRLAEALGLVYGDVRVAVQDWAAMRGRVAEAIHSYRSNPPPLPGDEIAEAIAFLDWLAADNFTLLGVREYRMPEGDSAADPVEGSGLGILADPNVKVLRRGRELVTMTPEIRAFLKEPAPLIVTKASVKSRVHRRVHLDYVGVKLFTPDGLLSGELRVVGLFTSSAYTETTGAIPYVRHKVAQVIRRAGFDPASYSGRALLNVLESYPRDELFQVGVDQLLRFATDILTLYERPRVRVLARPDRFDRFVSVLVYIPKDRYDTQVRNRVGQLLAQMFKGRLSAAYPAYPEGPLARTHYIIGRDEGKTPAIERGALEDAVNAVVRTWSDQLADALGDAMEGSRARGVASRFAGAFSAAYREAFGPAQAIADIQVLERLDDANPRAVRVERRDNDDETRVNLKVFAFGKPLPLSERVPLLENLGFRVLNERTYRVEPEGASEAGRVWMHDMALERFQGGAIDVASLKPKLEAALMALFRGLAESDGYNALVLEAGLGWRDVAALRTLSRFLQQARAPFSQDYMWTTLAKHAGLAALLVELIYARFDPRPEAATGRDDRQTEIRGRIEAGLEAIDSLDEDRILRSFVNLIEASLRTSFFQLGPDGKARIPIAFKFDSHRIDGLPLPRPLYEICVHSPRVEGVHLRFGKVARGGLRWSDRRQDFRTEVLGLVKAQQVKNAVIVPVGAKGGFVPKHLPPASDRQAWMAEGVAAYKEFVGTLLDLTDNIDGDHIVPPADTVRHDGDDPYLVVAADKGTATFSDIANGLSIEHHHWLGDAFASGGSVGYDHKGMGITARGAWEAVKRHFREIDVDIQTTPFTVAGVGDMSGDVFGNGMLLSEQIRLVAAFDHRDIFLDPAPDLTRAFAERQRLFALPRSSWQDYDKALISKGGGVFPRSLKSIPLSAEIRAVLGFDKAEATPAEVMRAILKAPVDLLWFGGIGTYIRASSETDDQAGDRANDAVRITGAQVAAKVIGEGANLGATQLGRIEAAQKGVRLNTDAIDNSAGVNTSDVEVNIKIALAPPVRDGRLDDAARKTLLAEMTDEVGLLVLRNNYLQTLALSLSQARGHEDFGFARRLMQTLEAAGRLDRTVEYLPDEATLLDRDRKGETLTRPELAVLLAYSKLALHDALLDSRVPDDPYLSRELVRYFPKILVERFPDAVETHRLRREIIATQLANAIINRGGSTVVTRLVDQTGADAPTIAAAYAATRDSFDLLALNTAIDGLDARISGDLQLRLYRGVQDLLLSRMVWFIRHVDWSQHSLDDVVGRFRSGVAAVESARDAALSPDAREAVARRAGALVRDGVPEELAQRLATLPAIGAAPDIVLVAEKVGRPVAEIAAIHFAVANRFRLGALFNAAQEVPATEYYDRLALDRALAGIESAHRALTSEVALLGLPNGETAIDAWAQKRGPSVERIASAVESMTGSGLTLSKLTVAASLLADLVRA